LDIGETQRISHKGWSELCKIRGTLLIGDHDGAVPSQGMFVQSQKTLDDFIDSKITIVPILPSSNGLKVLRTHLCFFRALSPLLRNLAFFLLSSAFSSLFLDGLYG
jgi:hypothetical protein